MLARMLFALGFMLAVSAAWAGAAPKSGSKPAATPAKAEMECPHAYSDSEKIQAEVENAPTCAVALELFSACGSGASSDGHLGGVVVERCEKDFAAKLSKAQKRAYAQEGQRCDRKYANRQGTMYISFTAHCHADVALKYSRRFAKTSGQAPPAQATPARQ